MVGNRGNDRPNIGDCSRFIRRSPVSRAACATVSTCLAPCSQFNCLHYRLRCRTRRKSAAVQSSFTVVNTGCDSAILAALPIRGMGTTTTDTSGVPWTQVDSVPYWILRAYGRSLRNGRGRSRRSCRLVRAKVDASAAFGQCGDRPMTAPRRHWFRFSLRTMLLAVALVACSLVAWEHQPGCRIPMTKRDYLIRDYLRGGIGLHDLRASDRFGESELSEFQAE